MSDNDSDSMQLCLDRLMIGDPTAREELLSRSQERLHDLAERMLPGFPKVQLYEDANDVLQPLLIRMDKLLGGMHVVTVGAYFRLAAIGLHHILVGRARHCKKWPGLITEYFRAGEEFEPEPHAELADDPGNLAEWSEFHELVGQMPKQMCEVFVLLYYRELPHKEAARLLNVSVATLDRRWNACWTWLDERQGIPTF